MTSLNKEIVRLIYIGLAGKNSILSRKITDNCLQESLLALEQEGDIHNELDSIHSKFCNILQTCLIESTPLPKDHNHKSNPWCNKELHDMHRVTNNLRRKYQRSLLKEDQVKYKNHLKKI